MPKEPTLDPIAELARAKGISRHEAEDITRATLRSAMVKKFGPTVEFDVAFSPEITITRTQTVVDVVTDPVREISLADARAFDPDFAPGDVLESPVPLTGFGRYATQAAKQSIRSQSRTSTHSQVRAAWSHRTGDMVTATVMTVTGPLYQLRIKDVPAEVVMSSRDATSHYRVGDTLEAVLLTIEDTNDGPRFILSQTAAEYVTALFERHSEAVRSGRVRVIRAAREQGVLTKILVESSDPEADPVSLYVGPSGRTASLVERELGSERLEILANTPDLLALTRRAMEPATLASLELEGEKNIIAYVPESEMGLAMGRKKSNVRLASKIVDRHILLRATEDTLPTATQTLESDTTNPPLELLGLSPQLVSALASHQLNRLEDIIDFDTSDFARLGLSPIDITTLVELLDDIAPEAD